MGTRLTEEKDEIDFILSAEKFGSRNLNSSFYQDEKTGWIFYNVYDQDYFMRDVSQLQKLYWFLLIIDVLVAEAYESGVTFGAIIQRLLDQ